MRDWWLTGCTILGLLCITYHTYWTQPRFTGILFLPRQDKWKNLPLVQLVLEHLTSLSFFSATALHVQIEFIFIASLITLADCCLEPPRLNSGKALHFGQYQVLEIASMPRHDK